MDKIYRATEWSSEYKGYGFEITGVSMQSFIFHIIFDWLSVLLHIILTLYVQVLKHLKDEIGESLLASLFTMIFPH